VTTQNYRNLQILFKRYAHRGLVVLGFPCNQFGKQEPGTNEEIKRFTEEKYGITFPLFSKIDVNGSNSHPIFSYLRGKLPGEIVWNFTKFLVNQSGEPVKRFGSRVDPFAMEADVKDLLGITSETSEQQVYQELEIQPIESNPWDC